MNISMFVIYNKFRREGFSRRKIYQFQFLVDEARADFLVVVYLVDNIGKDISH